MNLEKALKLADKIVFEKTGKHLNDLQKAVLKVTLQRETYQDIAKEFDCSEGNVRKAGAELWQIISEKLEEKVTKSNFRSAMERFHNSNVLNFAENVSDSFNVCPKERHPPDTQNSHQPNQQTSHPKQPATPHQDLDEMPELGDFYNRTTELETLTNWILQQHCRLIALTGIAGIGKTTLAVKLVQQIKDNFDYVIWRSLETSPTFAEFQADLVQFLFQSQQQNSLENTQKPLPLIKYLQKHRCLVVLDDIHHLFSSGELAGKYKPGYENYGYQGNPLWLKSVASQIQELEENLIELLPDDAILLPEDLKDILQETSDRLSQPEKQTLSLLATKNQPISLAQLLETTQT